MRIECSLANTIMKNGYRAAVLAVIVLSLCVPVFAQDAPPEAAPPAPTLDSGDTAWMLTSTALVLFMTIPGLSLFYGGLVRAKNVLSVLMQCFVLTAMITILWTIFGYSIAFDTTGMVAGTINLNSFIGTGAKLFLRGVTNASLTLTIPEAVFICFQLTFAIITPALIVGAFAERMRFSAMLLFMLLWSSLVYLPVCHMVWAGPGSLLGDVWGVLDFAGGTVVHINAGIAALVCALVIGRRQGYPQTQMMPHNLGMTVTGAGMLWVGWFGFNAGSAVAANGTAGMAMLTTQIATATAAMSWMAVEWFKNGKPSVLGIVTGAVAGLVAITPASGTAGPMGALLIGAVVGVLCFVSSTMMKRALGYDDALDAFGVHGVGGIVGALLTGVCASPMLGGFGAADLNIATQLGHQLFGCLVTIAYSGVLSFVILKVVGAITPLRPTREQEDEGLDIADHEERGYSFN